MELVLSFSGLISGLNKLSFFKIPPSVQRQLDALKRQHANNTRPGERPIVSKAVLQSVMRKTLERAGVGVPSSMMNTVAEDCEQVWFKDILNNYLLIKNLKDAFAQPLNENQPGTSANQLAQLARDFGSLTQANARPPGQGFFLFTRTY